MTTTPTFEIDRRPPWLLAVKQITVGILILVGIETLNQFLIASGSNLSHALQGRTVNTQFWVGVYQQIVQAAAGILLYKVFFNKGMRDLGINLNNKTSSLYYFGCFALAWLGIIAIYLVSNYFFSPENWSAMSAATLPPAKTITTTLIFQSIFPGMGEEILFRGLILNLLAKWVFPRHKQHKASLIGMVILSSFYFAAAHVYFQVVPFELTHFDSLQFLTALGCSAVYTVMFLRTKSLLAPFLSHNFANTTTMICGYLIACM